MDRVKNALERTTNFVYTHRTAMAVTGTAVAALVIVRHNKKVFDEFLTEKGLMDEFYCEPEA